MKNYFLKITDNTWNLLSELKSLGGKKCFSKIIINSILLYSLVIPSTSFAGAQDLDVTEAGIEDYRGKKGKSKRKCKRGARKKGRELAKELCGGGKSRKCKRKVRRDVKGYAGAYGFVGAKKANAQSKANWDSYGQKKAELEQALASGQINQMQYEEMIRMAKRQRIKESNRIGRVKTIKSVAAPGVGAVALGASNIGGKNGSKELNRMNYGFQNKLNQMKAQNVQAAQPQYQQQYQQGQYQQC